MTEHDDGLDEDLAGLLDEEDLDHARRNEPPADLKDEMKLWWNIGTWLHDRHIRLVRAGSHQEACAILGAPASKVQECVTPWIVRPNAERPPGDPWTLAVEDLPSVYDQFRRPGYRGWDYQAMEDAGYDVS